MGGIVRKGGMDGGRGGVRLVPGLAVRAGQTIAGKYRVEELLGSGASGIVISARNIHLRQPVVLKILASYTDGQEELLQRRLTKARLAARLQSSHVARIVDIGMTEDAMPYVATECLEGTTLEVELEERGHLPVDEAVRWVLEACEGLAEGHAAGLIHGDLKPQNIFLAKPKAGARSHAAINDGADDASIDPRVLKILDFGTTSPLDGIGDQSAAFFGSPAFLAPEQIKDPSNVDARADVWALGVLLYNLVSGGLPFAADTVSGVIVAVVYDAPAMLVDAPYELAKIVARCLEKDPGKRPGDVKELAAELAPFAGALGARLSERVAAMLAGASAPSKPSDSSPADASTSINPVSVTVEPPIESDEALPLVTLTRPAAAPVVVSEVTHRSKRVVARRSRARTLGLLGAVALLAVVGGAATRMSRPGSASSTTTLTSEHIDLPAPVATINAPVPTVNAPVATINAPITTTDELPRTPDNAEPVISFAPSALQPSTPTPLAVTPTPLASDPIAPEVLPDVPSTPPLPLATAPAPRPATAPATTVSPPVGPLHRPTPPPVSPPITVAPVARSATTAARSQVAPVGGAGTTLTRLPAGLPTSREPARDPLPPFGGASPPRQAPSAPRNNQPSLSSTRTDGSNSRNLFSERK